MKKCLDSVGELQVLFPPRVYAMPAFRAGKVCDGRDAVIVELPIRKALAVVKERQAALLVGSCGPKRVCEPHSLRPLVAPLAAEAPQASVGITARGTPREGSTECKQVDFVFVYVAL